MRDKEAPGDTYNYKEHVYADPVALNLRKDQEKEVEAEEGKAGNVKKYQKPGSPPQVPNGPRQAQGPGGTGLYAELPKKTNVPRVSVRDLGSRFGGTVQRAGRAESAAVVNDDPPPPPLPEVTDSRNILDDSPPGSPAKISNTDNQLVPNIPNDENDGKSAPDGEVVEPSVSDPSGAVSGEMLGNPDEGSPGLANSEQGVLQEERDAPSPIDTNEVVIDVRINSEAGIEIGAELPVAAADSTAGTDGETEDENGGGIRLIKSIKHDPFAVEDSSKSGPVPVVPATAGAKQQERSSETSSASGGSVKRKKKKDVESELNINGHLRRNLILVSLFLLIILIIVSAVVVVLLKYPDVL